MTGRRRNLSPGLYVFPPSPYCIKAWVAALEAGIDTAIQVLDIRQKSGFARLKRVAPWGKVPFLVEASGSILSESSRIAEHFDGCSATSTLVPDASHLAIRVREVDSLVDSQVNAGIAAGFHHAFGLTGRHTVEEIDMGFASARRALKRANQSFAFSPWALGESFTLADCSLVASLAACRRFLDVSAYRKLGAYWTLARDRESVSEVLSLVERFEAGHWNGDG